MAKIEVRVEAVIYSGSEPEQVLLVRHKKADRSYWVLPGGHLEFGESLTSCIERELDEELFIVRPEAKDLIFIDEYFDEEKPRHIVKIGFLVEIPAAGNENITVKAHDEALAGVRFYKMDDLINSKDEFYPSREFFTGLLKLNSEHGAQGSNK